MYFFCHGLCTGSNAPDSDDRVKKQTGTGTYSNTGSDNLLYCTKDWCFNAPVPIFVNKHLQKESTGNAMTVKLF
jgi:hypothetical protein